MNIIKWCIKNLINLSETTSSMLGEPKERERAWFSSLPCWGTFGTVSEARKVSWHHPEVWRQDVSMSQICAGSTISSFLCNVLTKRYSWEHLQDCQHWRFWALNCMLHPPACLWGRCPKKTIRSPSHLKSSEMLSIHRQVQHDQDP